MMRHTESVDVDQIVVEPFTIAVDETALPTCAIAPAHSLAELRRYGLADSIASRRP